MVVDEERFITFLLRAKRATYAAGVADGTASRPASHDLHYAEGDLEYIDTYLGGFKFAGEEAVWRQGQPFWSMNYYGRGTVAELPEGFSHCLKAALLAAPAEAPYRGPTFFADGRFEYRCEWRGELECFQGFETITFGGELIYELWFQGGEVV